MEETHFGHFYPRSHSIGPYLKLMTTAEGWSTDQLVNRKLQISIHQNSPVQGPITADTAPIHLSISRFTVSASAPSSLRPWLLAGKRGIAPSRLGVGSTSEELNLVCDFSKYRWNTIKLEGNTKVPICKAVIPCLFPAVAVLLKAHSTYHGNIDGDLSSHLDTAASF